MSSPRAFASVAKSSAVAAAAVTLTMLALTPTLGEGEPWLRGCLIVIATVAAVGTAVRWLAWPRWVVVLAQSLALLMVMTWMFASEVARYWVLPGRPVWEEFSQLAQQGLEVIGAEAAPITVTEGVAFLVVLGVAAIALLVDVIAVGWRQATLAGIPLLTLYLVPAVVLPGGVPWPLFLLAGVGWLLLLLADGRRELSAWGRTVASGPEGRTHAVGGTGRRLGAAALAVALIVPVILPSLDDGRFGLGTGEGDGDGDGSGSASASDAPVTTFNPITNLKKDLQRGNDNLVLLYQTSATQPDYLRVATLTGFDGETWTLDSLAASTDQQVSDGIPVPAGTAAELVQNVQTYDVQVVGLSGKRLPVPYPAEQVEIDGDWRWDPDTLDVFAPNDDSLDQLYRVTDREIAPTVDQLRSAPAAETPPSTMTDLPDETAVVLGDLPERVTEGAATSYDQALELQNWFRTKFTYSLDRVVGNSNNALAEFLDSRSGYCEQFAASMALMARSLGIPSRVVVGYTPGERTDDGVWEVTAHDAHAWPELWFEGVGWVRFEPTPGGGDGGATPAYAPPPREADDPSKEGQGGSVTCRRGDCSSGPGRSQRPPVSEEVLKANTRGAFGGIPGQGESASGTTSRWWLLLTLLVVVALAAVAPVTARAVDRRRRWSRATSDRAAVEAAWRDVLDATVDVEIPATKVSTPRDVASMLPKRCRLSTHATHELAALAALVERLRYSDRAVEVPSAADLRRSAEAIRSEIYDSLAPRDRRQVAVWPASGRQTLADWWNGFGESAAGTARRANRWVDSALRGRLRGAAPSAPRSGS